MSVIIAASLITGRNENMAAPVISSQAGTRDGIMCTHACNTRQYQSQCQPAIPTAKPATQQTNNNARDEPEHRQHSRIEPHSDSKPTGESGSRTNKDHSRPETTERHQTDRRAAGKAADDMIRQQDRRYTTKQAQADCTATGNEHAAAVQSEGSIGTW